MPALMVTDTWCVFSLGKLASSLSSLTLPFFHHTHYEVVFVLFSGHNMGNICHSTFWQYYKNSIGVLTNKLRIFGPKTKCELFMGHPIVRVVSSYMLLLH